MPGEPNQRCPVCRAPWRGTRTCSRCGADLGPLMRVHAAAWRLRRHARDALREGRFREADKLAAAAADAYACGPARELMLLCRFCRRLDVEPPPGAAAAGAIVGGDDA